MANHILSPYWAVAHRRKSDYDFFAKLAPPVVKIMDGGPPDYAWVRQNLPKATLVARDWLLDDGHGNQWRAVLADPVGTGKRHANEWKGKQAKLGFDPATTYVQGVNEPKVWEPGAIPATVAYTVAFLDECARLGLRAGALALSVGWPANNDTDTIKDTPPNWAPYAAVLPAIKRGNHCLMLHEYWPRSGPGTSWGWRPGRALKCPWDVPILIGECGMSYAVEREGVPTAEQGWQKHISPETYAGQIIDYHNRMAADARVFGLCVYLCDFAAPEWWSKDLEPAYIPVLVRRGQLRDRATTPPPPVVVEPPPSSSVWRWPLDVVRITQFWGVPGGSFFRRTSGTSPDTYKAHEGIDFSCAIGTPVKAVADGVVAYVGADRDAAGALGGYGHYIRIRHGAAGKQWDSFYAHLREPATLAPGTAVRQGQVIAASGNTGNSTGPHLHFEVRLVGPDGRWETSAPGVIYNGCVDPVAFFEAMERAAAGGASPELPFGYRLPDISSGGR